MSTPRLLPLTPERVVGRSRSSSGAMSLASSRGDGSVGGPDSDTVGLVRLHSYERGLTAMPDGDVDLSDSDADIEVLTGLGGMGSLSGSLVGAALAPERSPDRRGDSGSGGHSHGGAHGHSHGAHHHGGSGSYASLNAGQPGSVDARGAKAMRQLKYAGALCVVFMILEVIGGSIANSLAIMTDAAHLLSDLLAFAIGLAAIRLAAKPPSLRLIFGAQRIEYLGALFSVLLIWVLTGALVYAAILRVLSPPDVDGPVMFVTAVFGLLVNVGMMKILHQGGGGHSHAQHGHSHGAVSAVRNALGVDHGHGERNINVQAAFIHAVGDLLQSVGVMIAAVIIWAAPSWKVADPLCTFLFSILVLFTTWPVFKRAVRMLLNVMPDTVNLASMHADLVSVENVVGIHNLHVWVVSGKKAHASLHAIVTAAAQPSVVVRHMHDVCASHGVSHATVQVEDEEAARLACGKAVALHNRLWNTDVTLRRKPSTVSTHARPVPRASESLGTRAPTAVRTVASPGLNGGSGSHHHGHSHGHDHGSGSPAAQRVELSAL